MKNTPKNGQLVTGYIVNSKNTETGKSIGLY